MASLRRNLKRGTPRRLRRLDERREAGGGRRFGSRRGRSVRSVKRVDLEPRLSSVAKLEDGAHALDEAELGLRSVWGVGTYGYVGMIKIKYYLLHGTSRRGSDTHREGFQVTWVQII